MGRPQPPTATGAPPGRRGERRDASDEVDLLGGQQLLDDLVAHRHDVPRPHLHLHLRVAELRVPERVSDGEQI